jgi:hypothetical protein
LNLKAAFPHGGAVFFVRRSCFDVRHMVIIKLEGAAAEPLENNAIRLYG